VRVRSCRSPGATGTPRQAGASGHEKVPATCQRLRVDSRVERTSVSSNDQAPANVRVQLRSESQKRRKCPKPYPETVQTRVSRRPPRSHR
jgi:hypothetical protein